MQKQIATTAPTYVSTSRFAARRFQAEAWGAGEHVLQQSGGPNFEAFEEHDRDDANLLAERMDDPAC